MIPGGRGAVGYSEVQCASEDAGDGSGRSGRLQVPPMRTRCPRAGSPWLQAWGSPRVGSSSVQWFGAQVPGLAGEEALLLALASVSLLSPPPLFFFSHPLFRRHQLQLLQSVKNVKEIFQ